MPAEDKERELLDALRQDVTCGACRELFTAPVALPCGHVFCSLCARRALSTRSRCLEAHCTREVTTLDLRPVRPLATVAARLDNRALPDPGDVPLSRQRRPHLMRSNRTTLIRYLNDLGMSTLGSVDELNARYRDFVMRWNANLDDVNPVSERTVASRVGRAERELAAANSRQRAVFRRVKPLDAEAGEPNPDAPNAGDTFETLMAKVRRRENRPPPGAYTYVGPEPPDDGQEQANPGNRQQPAQNTANDRAVDLIPTSSPTESDLAYADAAGAVSQHHRNAQSTVQQQNQVPPSPTESDLLLMAAADQAVSRSQELAQGPGATVVNNRTHRQVEPRNTAYDSNGSQSTQSPSPQPPTPQRTTPIRPDRSVPLQPPPPQQQPARLGNQRTANKYGSTPPRAPPLQQQQNARLGNQRTGNNYGSTPPRAPPPLSQFGAGSITIGPRAAQVPRQRMPSTIPSHPARHNAQFSVAPPHSSPKRTWTEPQTTNNRFHQPASAQGAAERSNAHPRPISDYFSTGPVQTPAPTHGAFASIAPNGIVTEPVPRTVHVNISWSQQVSNATQPSFSQPAASVAAAPAMTDELRERIERNRQRAIALQMAKRRRVEASRTGELGGS